MKKIFLLVLISALSACASKQPDMYYWGNYETLLYDMYINPGEAEPGIQIDKITQDIQLAEDQGKQVPPGVHAHLGFMYAAQGNLELAAAAFLQEQTLYPESKELMTGMIDRATKGEQL